MEIKTVKIQGQGYLLNNTMSVPTADGNREYELIKQWLAEGNTPEPEFTDEEILEANMELNKRKHETYLKDTEWVESYYIKHLLGIELIPEDSNKWNIIKEREISKKYLREL